MDSTKGLVLGASALLLVGCLAWLFFGSEDGASTNTAPAAKSEIQTHADEPAPEPASADRPATPPPTAASRRPSRSDATAPPSEAAAPAEEAEEVKEVEPAVKPQFEASMAR